MSLFDRAPKWLWVLLGASAALSAAMVLTAWSVARRRDRAAASGPAAPEPVVVSAQDLLHDYADNPARAGELYGQGRIRVRGQVSGVLGTTSILLEHFPAVTCFGLPRDEVAGVNRGDEVTVEGRVALGNAGGVHLRSCRLVR